MSDTLATAFVEIRPNLDAFREELDEDLDRDMADSDRSVHIDLDTDDFDAQLATSKAALKASFGDQTYSATLGVNDEELAAKIDEDVARMHDLSDKIYSIKVRADDGEAKAQLELLKADADRLSEHMDHPDISVEGVDRARAELDELEGRLDEFGHKDARAKVSVDKGSADRDLRDVEDAAKDLIGKADGSDGGGGSGLAGVGTAGEGAAGGLSTLTEAAIIASPTLIPLGAALTAAIGGITSLATAGTAGLGIFALAIGSTGKSFETEADHILKSWQTAMAPFVKPVLADFVKLVGPLLQDLSPIVEVVGKSLEGVAGALGDVIQGPAFAKFIDFLTNESPLAIKTFATSLINIAEGFGGIVEAFGPFSKILAGGIDDLTSKFAAWGQSLSGSSAFTSFMDYVKQNGPALQELFGNLAKAIGDLIVGLAPLGEAMLKGFAAVSPLLPLLAKLIGVIGDIIAWGLNLTLFLTRDFVNAILFVVANWREGWGLVQLIWTAVSSFLVSAWNTFTSTAERVWQTITGTITSVWNDVFGDNGVIEKAWSSVAGFLTSAWGKFETVVSAAFGSVKSGTGIVGSIAGAFGALPAAIGAIWNEVGNAAAAGINGIIRVLKDFLGIVDDVAGHLGVKIDLAGDLSYVSFGGGGSGGGSSTSSANGASFGGAPQQRAADGATIGAGFMTKGPQVVVGEGRQQYPEFVIPTDPQYAGNARQLIANAAGIVGMAGGGWIDDIGHAASSIGGDITGGLSAIAGFAQKLLSEAASAVLAPEKAVLDSAASAIGGPIGAITEAVVNELFSDIGTFLDGKQTAQQASAGGGTPGPGGVIPSGQHLALIRQALGLAGVAATPENEKAVDIIVTYESGWNPNAINNSDINAQEGDPSRGLMQTIMTTFEAYRDPSLPNNIYNPLANMVAGIRYAESRYGTLDTAGVLSVEHGGGYQGYASGGILGGTPMPYQVLDQGGWLPTGVSMVGNFTGSPEAVPGPGGGSVTILDNRQTIVSNDIGPSTMQTLQGVLDADRDKMFAELTPMGDL